MTHWKQFVCVVTVTVTMAAPRQLLDAMRFRQAASPSSNMVARRLIKINCFETGFCCVRKHLAVADETWKIVRTTVIAVVWAPRRMCRNGKVCKSSRIRQTIYAIALIELKQRDYLDSNWNSAICGLSVDQQGE